MNFKNFFASVLAVAAIAVACNPTEGELKEASLKLEGENSFTLDSKTQTIEVSILTTRDWTATPSADWLVVDPESGSASDKAQKVEITVLENTSYDRTATVTFSIGTTSKKVTVSQTGNSAAPDGTKESPFNIEYAVAKCVEIGQTASTEKYYVKGIISNIKEIDTGSYGNAIYTLSDDGTTEGNQFTVYRGYYLDGAKFTAADQIKVGDEVIVYCTLVNYYGNTPETGNTGAPIVCLNGVWGDGSEAGGSEITTEPKGSGTADDPFNAAAAIQKCVEIGTTASEEEYYVKGKISKGLSIDTSYGNANFYISDDGTTATDQFLIYRCYYFGGEKFAATDQLQLGDEVVIKGKLINYSGNTPEMTSGGQLVTVNGGTEVSDYLTVSKASAEVPAEAGSIELSVTSNVSWTVSCAESFVTLSTSGAEGDGTVTVNYAENTASEARTATVSFTGAGKTVTFTLLQLEVGAAAATELTWTGAADWDVSDSNNPVWTNGIYTITIHKNNGSTPPAFRNDGSVRAYAKATVVVEGPLMQSIVINLAADANFRLPEITADSGEIAEQANGDETVVWTGSATSVTFTVGDKAIYGDDGADAAGQLRFASISVR
ncbi:MAG: BACON domain-containing protein [Candidatus Cryptobacteroides sp.]